MTIARLTIVIAACLVQVRRTSGSRRPRLRSNHIELRFSGIYHPHRVKECGAQLFCRLPSCSVSCPFAESSGARLTRPPQSNLPDHS